MNGLQSVQNLGKCFPELQDIFSNRRWFATTHEISETALICVFEDNVVYFISRKAAIVGDYISQGTDSRVQFFKCSFFCIKVFLRVGLLVRLEHEYILVIIVIALRL